MNTGTNTHTVLYDPEGLIEAELPLDREPHMCLVKAVLAWQAGTDIPPSDCEQIALQLTGHGRAVAADVWGYCGKLPVRSRTRLLTEMVLAEADRRLSAPFEGTPHCVRQRARMVRALYERLDRLAPAVEASPT
jgi:hypothetical protein